MLTDGAIYCFRPIEGENGSRLQTRCGILHRLLKLETRRSAFVILTESVRLLYLNLNELGCL